MTTPPDGCIHCRDDRNEGAMTDTLLAASLIGRNGPGTLNEPIHG